MSPFLPPHDQLRAVHGFHVHLDLNYARRLTAMPAWSLVTRTSRPLWTSTTPPRHQNTGFRCQSNQREDGVSSLNYQNHENLSRCAIARVNRMVSLPHAVAVVTRGIAQMTAPDDIALRTKDRKSTRLNSSHSGESRMPSSA